jgi:multiple sugar transport system substrate-binding protein
MGDKAGFAPSPAGPDGRRAPFVEGFGMSVSSRIPPERQERAIQFVRWFLSPATQSNWTERTSLSFSAARLKDPKYLATRPYLEAYAETLQCMRGFWSVQPAEALVAQLEKHIGDAVDGYVDTAKALDRLVLDWESTLRQAGLLSQY